jgi:hypothetical protein
MFLFSSLQMQAGIGSASKILISKITNMCNCYFLIYKIFTSTIGNLFMMFGNNFYTTTILKINKASL